MTTNTTTISKEVLVHGGRISVRLKNEEKTQSGWMEGKKGSHRTHTQAQSRLVYQSHLAFIK